MEGRLDDDLVGSEQCLSVCPARWSLAGEEADFVTCSRPWLSTIFMTGPGVGFVRMDVDAVEWFELLVVGEVWGSRKSAEAVLRVTIV